MALPLPLKLILELGAAVVVNPVATGVVLTQLEVAPLNAKLLSVPLLDPAASVKDVTPVFTILADP